MIILKVQSGRQQNLPVLLITKENSSLRPPQSAQNRAKPWHKVPDPGVKFRAGVLKVPFSGFLTLL